MKYNIRDGVIRFKAGDAVVTPIGEREIVVSCDLHGCTLANRARYAPERLEPSAITPNQIRALSQIGYRVTGEYRKNVWLNGNGEDVMTTVSYLPKFIAEMTNPQPPTPMKYTLRDTFNDITVSSHRSLEAAVAADIRFGKAVKRANGQSSYIPTEILCDGKRLTDDQAEEAWSIYENLRNS